MTTKKAQQNTERLTAELARRVMGWAVAPDRFLTGQRGWMPRWRFQPTNKLEDAFRVLEAANPEFYRMGSKQRGTFVAEVCINGKVGKSEGDSKPLGITLAVARALGLEAR
jgi:hypothetical protein